MSQQWLVYWREDQIQDALHSGLLDHAASNQFASVRRGDTLWLCGRTDESALVTVGPLRVYFKVGQREAEKRLNANLWKARFHVIAKRGAEESAFEVPLDSVLARLRFESKQRPELDLEKPLGQQLQRVRQLTQSTANVLQSLWYKTQAQANEDLDRVQQRLESAGDRKVTVLQRKEQSILRRHLFGSRSEGKCVICGLVLPVSLLVAAHIKPRSLCTEAERLDIQNVVPMCLFGCDALFERGWIAVKNGIVSLQAGATGLVRLKRLAELKNRKIELRTEQRERYFRWHATYSRLDGRIG